MISPERFTRTQTSQAGNAIGPVVNAHATPHTKGSWTSLITTTNFDVFVAGVTIYGLASAGADTASLVDIGYDDSGGTSFVSVIPNILAGGTPSTALSGSRRQYWFPVFIPKGSQVAARMQSLISGDASIVGLRLLGGKNRSNPWPHRGAIQDYGTNLATSNGTAMANAAADTKSAWTQLGADTTRRHSGLCVATAPIGAAITGARHYVDIGIDPAGGTTYSVVIPDVETTHTASEESCSWIDPMTALMSIDIPVGASIAARSASTALNTGTQLAIAVYAF